LKNENRDLLPVGKLPPGILKSQVLSMAGINRSEVLVGPGIGEDAAVIDLSDIRGFLVVASDPVVGASINSGRLLVNINVNDVACKGADPAYFTVTLLCPRNMGIEFVERTMKEIDSACREMNISIIGGHTEITDRYEHPVLSGTMMGISSYNYSASDISSGDLILMTKHAGLEGMSILANDRPDLFRSFLSPEEISEVTGWSRSLSIYRESKLLRDIAKFMHDPTEGGIIGGISEIAELSGFGVHIDPGDIPIHDITRKASINLGFDHSHMISSGVLVAVFEPSRSEEALSRLAHENIQASVIGHMVKGKGNIEISTQEELWRVLDL